jgi:hypothetical protein
MDALVGGFIATAALLPLWSWFYVLQYEPYTNVVLEELIVSEESAMLIASFEKNDTCTYIDLAVFGGIFEQWTSLPWRDLEGPQGDRLAGGQTLRIEVEIDQPYHTLEIRTRHDCGGHKVDRVFISTDLN